MDPKNSALLGKKRFEPFKTETGKYLRATAVMDKSLVAVKEAFDFFFFNTTTWVFQERMSWAGPDQCGSDKQVYYEMLVKKNWVQGLDYKEI